MLRKVLLVSVIVVMFGLGWLGSWIYSDGEVVAQATEENPLLDEHTAQSLAQTRMLSDFKLAALCLEGDVMLSATYNGTAWVVENDRCAFIIDDRTGEITGP